ncbi:MAG: DUF2029 domain-containing protein [Chloroflexi bacterium]|nr:DUF2029 domain-containing protein [Chloroflexota bacterium]
MNNNRSLILRRAFTISTFIVLGALFYFRAIQNYLRQDYTNSNFFFFWLSGRMINLGQNPYDPVQWLAGHAAFGATWIPNKIFPYPLPLAFFMTPLGLLPLGQSYIAWQIVSQIMIFLLFFGPVFLTLQIGSIGPLALGAVLLSILSLEKKRSFLAGAVLALTILKPPQGITILALAGIWFLARRDWKAILGLGLGGIFLLLLGIARDPLWLVKFRAASQAVLERTLGIHSNIYSFAYLACGQDLSCMWIFGTLGTLLVLGLGGIYLWRSKERLTPWEAFNIILPLGFVSTIYLWSYDQLLYVIPITWITAKLIERTKSYIPAFIFLIVLDLFSFAALLVQANTRKDLFSIATTILTLGMCLLLMHWKAQPEPSMPTA